MLNVFGLNSATVIVGIAVAALIALVCVKMVRDKKNGKSSCGCSCAGCPGRNICHSKSEAAESGS